MSILWVLPLIFLAAGAVLMMVALRKSSEVAIELRDECARLEELRTALVDLRADAEDTRNSVDRIRSRGFRRPVDQ